jgi:SNF2 family DNA or RNA helicase
MKNTQKEETQHKNHVVESEEVHVEEQCVNTHDMMDQQINTIDSSKEEMYTISLDGVVFPEMLQKYLKKHQVRLWLLLICKLEGIKFFWSNYLEKCGCILADFMGLGKTLTTVVFLFLYLSQNKVVELCVD